MILTLNECAACIFYIVYFGISKRKSATIPQNTSISLRNRKIKNPFFSQPAATWWPQMEPVV